MIHLIKNEYGNTIGWELKPVTPEEQQIVAEIRDLQFFGFDDTYPEYIANNRLIDHFMESNGEYHSHKDASGSEVWSEYKPNRYHSDWNLLMKVVEKLKKVTNDDVFLDSLDTSNCRVSIILETELESCFRKSTLEIETVYNTCVEFIKWYNQQK